MLCVFALTVGSESESGSVMTCQCGEEEGTCCACVVGGWGTSPCIITVKTQDITTGKSTQRCERDEHRRLGNLSLSQQQPHRGHARPATTDEISAGAWASMIQGWRWSPTAEREQGPRDT